MTDAVMYAKYNQAGNKAVYDILSGMPCEEREKDRGGFYGSLSGMLRHVTGGTTYFLGMFEPALTGNAAATNALASLPPAPEKGALDDAQWKKLGDALDAIDAAYVAMAEALNEPDLKLPVKLDWYDGDPESVPLAFMLSQLLVHNTHHRGQISQALDVLKIEHEFSGIHMLPD